MNSGSRHLSSAACFLQSQPRSHKKTRAPCGGGLNPILRGDELEGEELQNNDGPLAPPTFLHAVTSVAIVQWTVGKLSGMVFPLSSTADAALRRIRLISRYRTAKKSPPANHPA